MVMGDRCRSWGCLCVQVSALQYSALQIPATQPPVVSARESIGLRLVPPCVVVCKVLLAGLGCCMAHHFDPLLLGFTVLSCQLFGVHQQLLYIFHPLFSCLWQKDLFGNSYSILASLGNPSF